MARCGVHLALLLRASSNRVYGEAAFDLAQAELALLDRAALGGVVAGCERLCLGGVDYLAVELDGELDEPGLAVLANLSSLHAAFAVEGDLLRPLELAPRRCVDEDITTIQRYAGKTNEAFTHLLVNVALSAADGGVRRLLAGEPLRLLDPVCGRGTTLNRAVVYGMDAAGIELDRRDVEAYEAFFLTWLKDKRLKHQVERATLRKGRDAPARVLRIAYGRGKDRAEHRRVEVVHDDAVRVRDHLRDRSVDLLVGDLPYGVQHGSRTGDGRLQRRPAELLDAALPGWVAVLRPGAGVALAWNDRMLPRHEVAALLERAGLELVTPHGDRGFRHRVDRSITRDVVVARRP